MGEGAGGEHQVELGPQRGRSAGCRRELRDGRAVTEDLSFLPARAEEVSAGWRDDEVREREQHDDGERAGRSPYPLNSFIVSHFHASSAWRRPLTALGRGRYSS